MASEPSPSSCCVGSSCIPFGARWAFVGDSLTRYQFLDLVYTLHNGNDDHSRRTTRNPLQETTWHSWQEFYAGTHAELQPQEWWCDCYRREYRLSKFISNKVQGDATCEIRAYHRPECNASLWYFQAFGTSYPLIGHVKIPADSNRRWVPMTDHDWQRNQDSLWRFGGLEELLVRVIGPLQPTAIVMSSSFHSSRGMSYERVRKLARAAAPCVAWKTLTMPREQTPSNANDGIRETALLADSSARETFARDVIFDAGLLTRGMNLSHIDYWDSGGFHFTPQSNVYRTLNLAMIAQLRDECPGVGRRWNMEARRTVSIVMSTKSLTKMRGHSRQQHG